MSNFETENEIRMDVSNLYREETFTDNTVGTLRRITPVTPEGDPDPGRPVQFVGSTQVLTTAGPLPLSFEIEASTLSEAAEGFSDSYRRGVALYRAGRYTEAGDAFENVEREEVKADALYNLGNAEFRRGDAKAAKRNIDALVDKLDRQVKKYKEKLTDHHAREAHRLSQT